jgi:hypothetical protein
VPVSQECAASAVSDTVCHGGAARSFDIEVPQVGPSELDELSAFSGQNGP